MRAVIPAHIDCDEESTFPPPSPPSAKGAVKSVHIDYDEESNLSATPAPSGKGAVKPVHIDCDEESNLSVTPTPSAKGAPSYQPRPSGLGTGREANPRAEGPIHFFSTVTAENYRCF